jgi:hypothetical protein
MPVRLQDIAVTEPSMRVLSLLLLAAVSACSLPTRAGNLADLEVYDRSAGQVLPVYRHDGRLYIAGEPRHEYELRIRNRSGGRLLAVGSVDGVNVLSGQIAAPDQGGYVLDPYGAVSIAGWRKSLSRVAAFYFTALPDSYAARTGRPDDVGVIGVALFREKTWCCARAQPRDEPRNEPYALDKSEAAKPAAPPPAQAAQSADAAGSIARQDERLGTGHGRSEYSAVYETAFERLSDSPEEVITIWYDSRRNLLAQGVIPQPSRYAQREPNPFPGGFVPDP